MKRLIVDYGLLYNRIALLNNDVLEEIYIERLYDKSLVGNIYLGRVVNVVKSMSAAFIDIGLKKNAYIPLEDGIKSGSEILVQVRRDAVGEKGPTVTTDVSLSSRHLVLLPKTTTRTISRKIHDKKLKQEILKALEPHLENYGLVIRTDAKDQPIDGLIEEIKGLTLLWGEIEKNERRIVSNRLVYEDYDFLPLIEKEYLPLVDEVVINKKVVLDHPNVIFDLDVYPIFDKFGLETQIIQSLSREIKLHQGSFITIDETEALTAIDVNSGQFTGSNNKEETFLQVNLAAAKEIARQVKLRNIAGIIVVDFINMQKQENYQFLIEALKKYFKKDKSQPKIHGMTSLGLMEITRKKNRKSLRSQLLEPCDHCGIGTVISKDIIFNRLVNKIRLLKEHTGKDEYEVLASEKMYHLSMTVINGETYLKRLEVGLDIEIDLLIDETLNAYEFKTSGK